MEDSLCVSKYPMTKYAMCKTVEIEILYVARCLLSGVHRSADVLLHIRLIVHSRHLSLSLQGTDAEKERSKEECEAPVRNERCQVQNQVC
jgi:hypothetical protein